MFRKTVKLLCATMAIVLSCGMCFALVGCDDYSTDKFDIPVYADNDQITMFGDHGLTLLDYVLQDYKDVGFNTFLMYPGTGDVRDGAQLSKQLGLDMYLFGGSPLAGSNSLFPNAIGAFPNYFEQFDRQNLDFNKLDAFTGFYMIDEPGAGLFDEIADIYVPWYNKSYGNKSWHLNLLPSYATVEQLQVMPEGELTLYETYVDKYVKEVLNKVEGKKDIGMDHYPLRGRGSENFISDMYLSDLMTVAQAAKNAKVTLSNCIQTYGTSGMRYPQSAADINLQTYTSIAFGAQILEFYAYDSSGFGSMQCMVANGKKLPAYYYVQEAISEISKYDHVIKAFTWEGVMAIKGANHDTSIGFSEIEEKCLKSLNAVKSVSASEDTIIGQLKDGNGRQGYMLVNFTEPTQKKLDVVELEFENAKAVLMYRGGVEMVLKVEKNKITVPLEAGDGVFLIPLV